jgi:hypothetical protein
VRSVPSGSAAVAQMPRSTPSDGWFLPDRRERFEGYPSKPHTSSPGARAGPGDGQSTRLATAGDQSAQLADRTLTQRDLTNTLDIEGRVDLLGRASTFAWLGRADRTQCPALGLIVEDGAKAGTGLESRVAGSLPVLCSPKEGSIGLVCSTDGAAYGADTEPANGGTDLFELFDLVELVESADRDGRGGVPGDLPGILAVLEGSVVDVRESCCNCASERAWTRDAPLRSLPYEPG